MRCTDGIRAQARVVSASSRAQISQALNLFTGGRRERGAFVEGELLCAPLRPMVIRFRFVSVGQLACERGLARASALAYGEDVAQPKRKALTEGGQAVCRSLTWLAQFCSLQSPGSRQRRNPSRHVITINSLAEDVRHHRCRCDDGSAGLCRPLPIDRLRRHVAREQSLVTFQLSESQPAWRLRDAAGLPAPSDTDP